MPNKRNRASESSEDRKKAKTSVENAQITSNSKKRPLKTAPFTKSKQAKIKDEAESGLELSELESSRKSESSAEDKQSQFNLLQQRNLVVCYSNKRMQLLNHLLVKLKGRHQQKIIHQLDHLLCPLLLLSMLLLLATSIPVRFLHHHRKIDLRNLCIRLVSSLNYFICFMFTVEVQ